MKIWIYFNIRCLICVQMRTKQAPHRNWLRSLFYASYNHRNWKKNLSVMGVWTYNLALEISTYWLIYTLTISAPRLDSIIILYAFLYPFMAQDFGNNFFHALFSNPLLFEVKIQKKRISKQCHKTLFFLFSYLILKWKGRILLKFSLSQ